MSFRAGIPAPPISTLAIGPVSFHLYAVCIITGAALAVALTKRILARAGLVHDHVTTLAYTAVPVGVVGARLYHLATDLPTYLTADARWWYPFAIWRGGLGIWGGLVAGALTLIVMNSKIGRSSAVSNSSTFPSTWVLLGAATPGVALAQSIGRLGNWFNQELFGKPTTAPWALYVDLPYRPAAYARFETFHPTFAYEALWMLLGAAMLVLLARHLQLDFLIPIYGAWYAVGRFVVESLRVDPAPLVGGMRFNSWVSIALLVASLALAVAMTTANRKKRSQLLAAAITDDEDAMSMTARPGDIATVPDRANQKRMARRLRTSTVTRVHEQSEGGDR